MAEYIDREAAIKTVKHYAHMDIDKKQMVLDTVDDTLNIVARIEKIPAADVAPVVRCKDCKYAQNDYDGFSTTVGCNMLKCATGWHSFCSYGERKDGGAE